MDLGSLVLFRCAFFNSLSLSLIVIFQFFIRFVLRFVNLNVSHFFFFATRYRLPYNFFSNEVMSRPVRPNDVAKIMT